MELVPFKEETLKSQSTPQPSPFIHREKGQVRGQQLQPRKRTSLHWHLDLGFASPEL